MTRGTPREQVVVVSIIPIHAALTTQEAAEVLMSNVPFWYNCWSAARSRGETIGYFIPSREARTVDDLIALNAAATRLDALLAASGISEDELLAEFRHQRTGQNR